MSQVKDGDKFAVEDTNGRVHQIQFENGTWWGMVNLSPYPSVVENTTFRSMLTWGIERFPACGDYHNHVWIQLPRDP